MKHILIPRGAKYKANLHAHTTLSDGKRTPEQIKADYAARGYSVVAYTDHNLLWDHRDLCDDRFLALHGLEFDLWRDAPEPARRRERHINMIALEQDNLRQPCWHREKQFFCPGGEQLRDRVQFDPAKPDFERAHTTECTNAVFREAADAGFFVTYNHPDWSRDLYPDYAQFRGMHAMEIRNYSCVTHGYDEDNGQVYEDLLRQGQHFYCIAADDTHSKKPENDPNLGAYGGYILLWAEALAYRAVTLALEQGHFYACGGDPDHAGPVIEELSFENGHIVIETSPAARITVRTDTKNRSLHGEGLRRAEFDLNPASSWFRLVVEDENGFKAFTNAYFVEELP